MIPFMQSSKTGKTKSMVPEVRIGFPVGSNYWREHRGLLGAGSVLVN